MDKGEFYLPQKINDTLYKVIIIVLLTLALLILGYTAYRFFRLDYTQEIISWHVAMGILVLCLMPVHMLIKKNKIKKLSQEFINLITGKDIKHINNKEELLDSIKKRSLKEIADIFGMNLESMIRALQENDINCSTQEISLKDLAKENSKDMYQIFILILRLHVESSSPKKG